MNNNNRTTHQKDVSLKTFWRDNEHFADLFNATVFNGRQVLKPDKLTEMDTDVSATLVCSVLSVKEAGADACVNIAGF